MIKKTVLFSFILFSFIACGGDSNDEVLDGGNSSITKIPTNNNIVIPNNIKNQEMPWNI